MRWLGGGRVRRSRATSAVEVLPWRWRRGAGRSEQKKVKKERKGRGKGDRAYSPLWNVAPGYIWGGSSLIHWHHTHGESHVATPPPPSLAISFPYISFSVFLNGNSTQPSPVTFTATWRPIIGKSQGGKKSYPPANTHSFKDYSY